MRLIRHALEAGTVDPNRLTSVERRQYQSFQRREAANAEIRHLREAGASIKDIVRRTGYSRKVVREVVRGGRGDVFRVRASSLQPFLAQLEIEWAAGCRNGAELYRRRRAEGFAGALRVVTEWATRQRRNESAPEGRPRKPPSARLIARLMTTARDQLSKADALMVTIIEQTAPDLVAGRDLLDRFQTIVRSRTASELQPWISDAAHSLLDSFAAGIVADQRAVAAAITEPWSNGQTEGQITKLKLIKRQMYGRAKVDLLRARLCAA
jgi:transposase